MGEVESRIARQLLESVGVQSLTALQALRAARLFPIPHRGPASLHGPFLRYDESREGWEQEVWSLVCGELLRRAGAPDRYSSRLELAALLGDARDESLDVTGTHCTSELAARQSSNSGP